MTFRIFLISGFALGLLSSSALAIDMACQEKLDAALMTPFAGQAMREVETFMVDGKALSRTTTEYVPEGIKKATLENMLTPADDPAWDKVAVLEDTRSLKNAVIITTRDQVYDDGVARDAASKDTTDPAYLAYLEAMKGAPYRFALFARECTADSFVVDVDFLDAPRPSLDAVDMSAARQAYLNNFESMDKQMLFSGKVQLDAKGRVASFVYGLSTPDMARPGLEKQFTYTYDDSIRIVVPQ